jgi:hypothetical protein
MRVASDTRLLEVEPGATSEVVVDVVNNDQVIDGVTARIIGMPPGTVTTYPSLLPLFPDASGQVKLALAVPQTHPAGRHPLTVEVMSHGTGKPSQFLDVDLDVNAKPSLQVTPRPRLIRARRQARFVLEVINDGNIPLDVELTAIDSDRAVQTIFTPDRFRIEPGAVAPVLLTLRGPRMFTGSDLDRTVMVEAQARQVQLLLDPVAKPEAVVTRTIHVTLKQRPFIGRGLLTALILMSIVALWAGAFLLGLGKVFAGDPMTKEAPASFFAASAAGANGTGANGTGGTGGAGGTGANGAGAAPAGALPKNGTVPPGTGGTITGTVIAANDQQPVGRILIQAWRMGNNGLVKMSSAATQADGTYSLAGLFPTTYYLQFSASGYTSVWYPNTPTPAQAQTVNVLSQSTTQGVNATIVGLPASISGTINPGDTLQRVITTVTARPLLGPNTGKVAGVATTDATGKYTLKNLPAPETYQLTFQTPGYNASSITDDVAGGDTRLEPTLLLGASTGSISGTVTDGVHPLGGAMVSTTVGGKPLNVITPTVGQIGMFVLPNLTTPATYVVTFSAPGHGTSTQIVELKAGATRAGLNVVLASGTGSVTGRVVDSAGRLLGGATVTVGGAAVTAGGSAPSTTSLTAGSVGSFALNGLAVPGAYTLTASLTGYAPASVPVTLTSNGGAPNVTITLSTQLGVIRGIVVDGSNHAFPGATVSATNDRQTFTGISSTIDGSYLISNLQPGSYSVTVTAAGMQQQTALVSVVAGRTVTQNLQLRPAS